MEAYHKLLRHKIIPFVQNMLIFFVLVNLKSRGFFQRIKLYVLTYRSMQNMISSLLSLQIILKKCQRELTIISFKRRLTLERKRNKDLGIRRVALQKPRMSAFSIIFGSVCDQSFTTLTAFEFRSFKYNLYKLDPAYQAYYLYSQNGRIRLLSNRKTKRGCSRSMTPAHCFGLVFT